MRHFSVELEELNQKLLQMGALVESSIHRAVLALVGEEEKLAQQVLSDEATINHMEMEIDGLATRLLALRQPVARDLRLLTAALKINTDLERIGDLAEHIAKRALAVMHDPLVRTLPDLPRMEELVASMFHKCLDAFVQGDADLAGSVLLADEEVNRLRDAAFRDLLDAMRRDPAVIPAAITLIFIARNLERIGDHATNIAEDVVFLVKGIDVRHSARQSEG